MFSGYVRKSLDGTVQPLVPHVSGVPETYRQMMQLTMSLGHWAPHPRKIVQIYGNDDTALLMHAIAVGQGQEPADGWVSFGTAYVERGLGIDAMHQRVILRQFAADDLAYTKVVDGVRYIKVDPASFYLDVTGKL
jgi:hypothetical protein